MIEPLESTGMVLLGTAAALAVFHALVGVDHSLPFIVLARARGWTLRRTLAITTLCGLGHVASSVLIGGLGAAAGLTLDSLVWVEGARGELAAVLLISFGLTYAAWAGWRRLRAQPHSHLHAHADGTVHNHRHEHAGEHVHPHETGPGLTPWALFLIFVFGPCEPLIPLMVVPAMAGTWAMLAAVIAVFSVLTVGTMVAAVSLGYYGLHRLGSGVLEHHGDVLAGLTIAASGGAVLFLGL